MTDSAPTRKTDNPLSRGELFTQELNILLRSRGDGNLLAIDPGAFGEEFEVTFSELEKQGKPLTPQNVILETALRFSDRLKDADVTDHSQPMIDLPIMAEAISDISRYLNEHSDAKEKFLAIKIADSTPS